MDGVESERFAPAAAVQTRPIPDGAVLVDLDSGSVFEVNAVGAEIWRLLCAGRTNTDIIDQLSMSYAVDKSALESDFRDLLQSLTRAGLIVPQ